MYKLPYRRSVTDTQSNAECPRANESQMLAQMLFFSAATGKALTTFLAGFAFTTTTLPNISRLPAFVAGFVLTFNMARPGMVNLPVDLTSFVATAARLASTFLQSAAFRPVAVAIAAVIPDWDMAVGAIAEIWKKNESTICGR